MDQFAYVARKQCGCVVSAYVEGAVESKVLSKTVEGWICSGLTVQREEIRSFGIAVVQCRCNEKKPEPTLFDHISLHPVGGNGKATDATVVIRIGEGTVIAEDLDAFTDLTLVENDRLKPGYAALADPGGGEDLIVYVGDDPCPDTALGMVCAECLHFEPMESSVVVCQECDRAMVYRVPATAGVRDEIGDPFAAAA